MTKLTTQHKLAIINLMFAETANFINRSCTHFDNSDLVSVDTYCNDIAHNTQALNKFAAGGTVQELHDSIMWQDTLVREAYIEVLRYIEEENLIPAERHCCI